MKKTIIFLGLLALVWIAVPTAPTLASNYYYPTNNYQYPYQTQPTYTNYNYGYGQAMTNSQLSDYLRLLVIQLQSQVSSRPSYDYYGNSYGYRYNYVIGEPRSLYGDDDSNDDDDYYDNNDEEPDVETRSVSDVGDNDARLRGFVDMNDFEDGEVFFVYGTDRNQIEDVEDDYDSYNDVDTDGERLRKLKVDSSLDDSESFDTRVSSLNDDTRYYFSICVGYEDEDDDDVLACGSVLNFTTDN